jgi:hypothetical protein
MTAENVFAANASSFRPLAIHPNFFHELASARCMRGFFPADKTDQ